MVRVAGAASNMSASCELGGMLAGAWREGDGGREGDEDLGLRMHL